MNFYTNQVTFSIEMQTLDECSLSIEQNNLDWLINNMPICESYKVTVEKKECIKDKKCDDYRTVKLINYNEVNTNTENTKYYTLQSKINIESIKVGYVYYEKVNSLAFLVENTMRRNKNNEKILKNLYDKIKIRDMNEKKCYIAFSLSFTSKQLEKWKKHSACTLLTIDNETKKNMKSVNIYRMDYINGCNYEKDVYGLLQTARIHTQIKKDTNSHEILTTDTFPRNETISKLRLNKQKSIATIYINDLKINERFKNIVKHYYFRNHIVYNKIYVIYESNCIISYKKYRFVAENKYKIDIVSYEKEGITNDLEYDITYFDNKQEHNEEELNDEVCHLITHCSQSSHDETNE
ncbi:hypothetical protein BDAP_000575 [Binucleata daphniae]